MTDFDLEEFTEGCLALAARGRISGYDAEFVFVAERLGKPLVSADRKLAKAFPGHVLSPEEFVRQRLSPRRRKGAPEGAPTRGSRLPRECVTCRAPSSASRP